MTFEPDVKACQHVNYPAVCPLLLLVELGSDVTAHSCSMSVFDFNYS